MKRHKSLTQRRPWNTAVSKGVAANMHEICPLTEIPDGTARGFDVPGPDGPVELIVLRHGETVRAYVNACPHVGTPLNIMEDRFFTRDGRFLLCRTHGARFRPEDGICISGPCVGAGLRPYAVTVRDGRVSTAVDAGDGPPSG